MKKRIAILGSTGSIGCSALALLKQIPERFEIVGLTANENIPLLRKQVEEWQPRVIAVRDEGKCREIRTSVNLRKTAVLSGIEGISEIATRKDVDLVLSAIVGSAGLMPTMAAIEAGKQIALASKEPVVMAGELLMAEVTKRGATLIPVDSEPNAIFQCLQGRKKESVRRLIVTASGGPFRNLSREKMSRVTPEEALSHPAWKMGKKISVDSATMINKGLEVIEAHYMFGIPVSKIDVVVHPEAKIHSMVEFIDGNILAVIGITDMRAPIQYALTYPEKIPTPIKPLDLSQISPLTFQAPDTAKFPGLQYGYEAAEAGGTMPAVLNAANEIAVAAFIERKIGFLDITDLCRKIMRKHKPGQKPGMEEILEADRWAREETNCLIKNKG